MSEFSRRANVEIIKDEPLTFSAWCEALVAINIDADSLERQYDRYLDRFQPYRWRAVAANNEPVAHGESYFNAEDCISAVELLFADDTTVYAVPMYSEDRGAGMNGYKLAFYALGGIIGSVIGFLAREAGYGLLGRLGWIALVILLALLYGEAKAASDRRETTAGPT